MRKFCRPYMVENRPQTFLSRFSTTKSVLSGERKILRLPYGTKLSLTDEYKKRKFPSEVCNFFSLASNARKVPKMAKIVKLVLENSVLGYF